MTVVLSEEEVIESYERLRRYVAGVFFAWGEMRQQRDDARAERDRLKQENAQLRAATVVIRDLLLAEGCPDRKVGWFHLSLSAFAAHELWLLANLTGGA